MITTAPQPRLKDLLTLAAAGDGGIAGRFASPWDAPDTLIHWFSRGAWALAALAAGLSQGKPTPLTVWVPGHFCNQSLEPLRRQNVNLAFYPVDAKARPDWDACHAMLNGGAPHLFVLVHPFGFANDIDGAKAFTAACGALLIEDAAHVLRPANGIGDAGDAVLFCPHKLLPLPQGAVLRTRVPLLNEAVTKGTAALAQAAPPVRPWLAKRLIQTVLPSPLYKALRPVPTPDFDDDPAAQRLADTPRLNAAAVRSVVTCAERLDAMAMRRRETAVRLYDVASTVDGWQPFQADAPVPDAPYRAVLICDSHALAQARFATLRHSGFLAETWPDLPPEVATDPTRHAQALDLRQRILLLPLETDLHPKALVRRFQQAIAKA